MINYLQLLYRVLYTGLAIGLIQLLNRRSIDEPENSAGEVSDTYVSIYRVDTCIRTDITIVEYRSVVDLNKIHIPYIPALP